MDLSCFWAKKNRVNSIPKWLPLMIHLNDTMEVCGLLYEYWLSEGVKDFLHESVKSHSNDNALLLKNLCKFLGATHDIGKAIPIFQFKPSIYNDKELDDIIIDNLKKAGFKNIDLFSYNKKENLPHNQSGQYILDKFGVNFCVANIVGAHHGRPLSRFISDECFSYSSSIYQDDNINSDLAKSWQEIHKNIFDWAMSACDFTYASDLPLISQPGQVILSGLLIMADWIASNEYYFPLINTDDYIADNDRVQSGFDKWYKDRAKSWKPEGYFKEIYQNRFDFINEPRVAQSKVSEEINNIENPGIIILEAPMGMGKTETALVAVEELAQKTGRTGMFFALPTQATSNGIFSRVMDWIKHTDGGKSIRLIHGKAQLNEEFFNLPKSRNIYEDGEIGVNEWFAGRKLSILDDFVVGTVDQILLAALKQKHLMLRHLGFSNKVVVIDEVHAYDAYMSVYLYQAIRWLGAYRVPVVILSATLPIEKRNQLLETYMVGTGYKFKTIPKPDKFETNEAYPLLTYNDGEIIKQFDDFEKEYGQDYKIIKKSKKQSEDIVRLIKEITPDGGIVGVIVNTVKKAQNFAKKCVYEFGEDNVDLLHSSFIATDRYKKEKDLINSIGKNKNRPDFKIIIGTQVIEQSLDIDFDVMITDLAPMDLILQRMGRLHRHENAKRPNNLKDPKVFVLNCSNYDFDKSSTYVYSEYVLFRTEYYLPDIINLPNDISRMVQLVYSGKTLDIDDNLRITYDRYKEKSEREIVDKEKRAMSYRIGAPLKKVSEEKVISDWLKNSNHEAESSDIKASAQVRDSIDTVEVIALKACNGGYEFFDQDGLLDPSDNKTAMEIAKRTIKLPLALYYGHGIDKIIHELEKYYLENFSNWDNQNWLKGSLAIIFDEKNEFKILDKTLKYDVKYGLKLIKEDENE